MNTIQQISRINKLILAALWSFVFGIFAASLISIPPLVCVLIIIVSAVIYFAERHVFILIFLSFFALGAFRYDIKDFHELQPAGNTGIVVSEPERRDADTRFVVETNTGEKVLVSTDLLSPVEYGDEVRFSGSPKVLKPGGYADYLAKDDIFYTLDRTEVEIISHGNGHPVISALLGVKGVFVEKMKRILPEPESSLLAGLVVSGKQALPKETLEEFRSAGVMHIVVLSGFNVAVISEFFLIVFGFLGRRRAAIGSAVGIILFVLMSGASATVVRGGIMVLMLLLGKILNRSASAPRILLFTAVLMLLHNPKILLHDPSFHLSFLAVLGLIYGTPIVEKLFATHGHEGNSRQIAFRLKELISATLATQIFVLPYLLYNMGNFSSVFLMSNILILPVIPIVMLVGFIATSLAFISSILAWPLAFVSHLLLKWILFVASSLGNLSFALMEIENFPLWGSFLMYLILGLILWRARNFVRPSASLDS